MSIQNIPVDKDMVKISQAATKRLGLSITKLVNQGTLSCLPQKLYHYTTLETACKIVEFDNIRLSNAEYSNDQNELVEAKNRIETIIKDRIENKMMDKDFGESLLNYLQQKTTDLDVYVFCMSAGDSKKIPKEEDVLSQWRGYGQDGKGACISLEASKLADLTHHLPGLVINPVIYKPETVTALIADLLDQVDSAWRGNRIAEIAVTANALLALVPIIKNVGFEEEKEWRLIFITPHKAFRINLEFIARRDFLAPFTTLDHLWRELREEMMKHPAITIDPPPGKAFVPVAKPLVPILSIMVGPSGHQSLNKRAFQKLIAKYELKIDVNESDIPYRSLS
jgi:hypothetical protein